MKSTGIVRKIDELGRIVIPKEIRKHLNIKDGEEMEISIAEDMITLRKYQKVFSMQEKVRNLIETFYKHLNGTILLTDKEKILISLGENIENKKLHQKYINIMDERKKISNLENQEVEITKEYKDNKKYIFYPIIVNTDLLGSIIYLKDYISENDVLIFNILSTLVRYELEN